MRIAVVVHVEGGAFIVRIHDADSNHLSLLLFVLSKYNHGTGGHPNAMLMLCPENKQTMCIASKSRLKAAAG